MSVIVAGVECWSTGTHAGMITTNTDSLNITTAFFLFFLDVPKKPSFLEYQQFKSRKNIIKDEPRLYSIFSAKYSYFMINWFFRPESTHFSLQHVS